jgi:hypothetical protein
MFLSRGRFPNPRADICYINASFALLSGGEQLIKIPNSPNITEEEIDLPEKCLDLLRFVSSEEFGKLSKNDKYTRLIEFKKCLFNRQRKVSYDNLESQMMKNRIKPLDRDEQAELEKHVMKGIERDDAHLCMNRLLGVVPIEEILVCHLLVTNNEHQKFNALDDLWPALDNYYSNHYPNRELRLQHVTSLKYLIFNLGMGVLNAESTKIEAPQFFHFNGIKTAVCSMMLRSSVSADEEMAHYVVLDGFNYSEVNDKFLDVKLIDDDKEVSFVKNVNFNELLDLVHKMKMTIVSIKYKILFNDLYSNMSSAIQNLTILPKQQEFSTKRFGQLGVNNMITTIIMNEIKNGNELEHVLYDNNRSLILSRNLLALFDLALRASITHLGCLSIVALLHSIKNEQIGENISEIFIENIKNYAFTFDDFLVVCQFLGICVHVYTGNAPCSVHLAVEGTKIIRIFKFDSQFGLILPFEYLVTSIKLQQTFISKARKEYPSKVLLESPNKKHKRQKQFNLENINGFKFGEQGLEVKVIWEGETLETVIPIGFFEKTSALHSFVETMLSNQLPSSTNHHSHVVCINQDPIENDISTAEDKDENVHSHTREASPRVVKDARLELNHDVLQYRSSDLIMIQDEQETGLRLPALEQNSYEESDENDTDPPSANANAKFGDMQSKINKFQTQNYKYLNCYRTPKELKEEVAKQNAFVWTMEEFQVVRSLGVAQQKNLFCAFV